jgi:L,D-transpeptidase catalytic domain
MTDHRREVRPRYGRIAALSTALTVTVIAALAGMGVLTSGTASAGAAAEPPARSSSASTTPLPSSPATSAASTPGEAATSGAAGPEVTAPADSGTGRRIVFSESLQRVWLLDSAGTVEKTYLVSGSVTDNLQPGTYSVYSRSRHATGIDDSGTMEYFVRFTQGPTGAAIGFHSIPTKGGRLLQTTAQLGTAQSHGCIRQWKPDAIALWHFAPVGTKVVVVA